MLEPKYNFEFNDIDKLQEVDRALKSALEL